MRSRMSSLKKNRAWCPYPPTSSGLDSTDELHLEQSTIVVTPPAAAVVNSRRGNILPRDGPARLSQSRIFAFPLFEPPCHTQNDTSCRKFTF